MKRHILLIKFNAKLQTNPKVRILTKNVVNVVSDEVSRRIIIGHNDNFIIIPS